MSVISGAGTYAEQDALYAIGRTSGRKERFVTKARGGYSSHYFGIGFDVIVLNDRTYFRDAASYLAVGMLG